MERPQSHGLYSQLYTELPLVHTDGSTLSQFGFYLVAGAIPKVSSCLHGKIRWLTEDGYANGYNVIRDDKTMAIKSFGAWNSSRPWPGKFQRAQTRENSEIEVATKSHVFATVAVLAALLAGWSGSAPLCAGEPVLLDSLKRGPKNEYLLDDFAATVQARRSVLAALKVTTPDRLCIVDKDGDLFGFSFSDFDAAGGTLVVDGTGKTIKRIGMPESMKLDIIYSDSFSISQNGLMRRYRFVGDLEEFLRSATIAGHYQDSSGFVYEFDRRGSAIWRNEKFRYFVESGLGFSNRDRFVLVDDAGKRSVFGFEVVGNELRIWKN